MLWLRWPWVLRVKEMFLTRSQTTMPHILVRIESVLVLYTESKTCHGRMPTSFLAALLVALTKRNGVPLPDYIACSDSSLRLSYHLIERIIKTGEPGPSVGLRVCHCTPCHLSRTGDLSSLVPLRRSSRRKAICKSITGWCGSEVEGGSEYPSITSRVS